MKMLIIFIAGLFAGGITGFLIAGLFAAGKIEDSYRRGLVSGRGLKVDALEY